MRKKDILVCDGVEHTVEEWSTIKGISVDCLRRRFESGMSVSEALNTPVRGTLAERNSRHKRERYCIDCVYSGDLTMPDYGHWRICDYIGKTGKRRPCPYGAGCTVKVKKAVKKG